ncbi:DUF389 domain-containing protein [Pseudarthrobacter sp. NS4]|uniref:DUF389 domain-containing protein n=1 Tax=Pseudarthrobacter sp. NS4 TaxID=2973976 RepID=UPI002162D7A1|nr:DUF389 domain-containing protein [Pseudarthrobacter sp. NS4]
MADGDDDALEHVTEQATLTPRYLIYMTMAGVLAGVGLLSNSVPILVGSMIIAPALPPVALVAFGVVHRRASLVARGAGVAALGLGGAAVAAVLAGLLMQVTDVIPPGTELLSKPMLEERVRPGWWSLAAAVAGGVVGVVALTEKKTDTLIGTVAALALVPAGAAAGIAALAGDGDRALGGLLLLGMNFAMIVAMGILVLAVLRREAAPLPLTISVVLIAAIVVLMVIAHTTGMTPGQPPAIQSS